MYIYVYIVQDTDLKRIHCPIICVKISCANDNVRTYRNCVNSVSCAWWLAKKNPAISQFYCEFALSLFRSKQT